MLSFDNGYDGDGLGAFCIGRDAGLDHPEDHHLNRHEQAERIHKAVSSLIRKMKWQPRERQSYTELRPIKSECIQPDDKLFNPAIQVILNSYSIFLRPVYVFAAFFGPQIWLNVF